MRFGVQLSICILIRNVIFSVGFYLQISNKMYYLFFLLFLFVLEYISVHHNLPVVHNVLSLKYLFLYQILKWERIIPPTATDSYKKTYVSRYNRLPTFATQVSQGNIKVLSRRIALPRMPLYTTGFIQYFPYQKLNEDIPLVKRTENGKPIKPIKPIKR